jgi:hypothetical protein
MVSLAERAYRLEVLARYLAISVFICGSGGRVARPWSRSATHSDWISATGMTAPIGWTRPMKYSPAAAAGRCGGTGDLAVVGADQGFVEERKADLVSGAVDHRVDLLGAAVGEPDAIPVEPVDVGPDDDVAVIQLLSRLSDTVGGAHSSRRSGLGNPYFVTGPWAMRISSVTANPCNRSGTHAPRRMSVR